MTRLVDGMIVEVERDNRRLTDGRNSAAKQFFLFNLFQMQWKMNGL